MFFQALVKTALGFTDVRFADFHLPESCEDEETANLNDSGSQRDQKVAEDHSNDDL